MLIISISGENQFLRLICLRYLLILRIQMMGLVESKSLLSLQVCYLTYFDAAVIESLFQQRSASFTLKKNPFLICLSYVFI